jgi:membrane protease YdiL (CAAX protease family)
MTGGNGNEAKGTNTMDVQTSDTAQRLRGFGPLGVLAILVVFAGSMAGFVVSAVLVLVWAQLSDTPLRNLGFKAPRSWFVTLVGGVAFGIAFKFGAKAIVMPLLGAPAINAPYHYLAGNANALPAAVASVVIGAGFGEELFFRGYLFERLGALLGTGKAALTGTVLLSTALFALAHYEVQGLPGVQQATMTGLVFGGIYAWRKQIWFLIVAHAAFDLTAIAIIYGNWEEAVARLLFG